MPRGLGVVLGGWLLFMSEVPLQGSGCTLSTSSPLGDAPLETERAPFSGVTPPPAVLGATVFGAIISLSPCGVWGVS